MATHDCWECIYRHDNTADSFQSCANRDAKVHVEQYGKENGWGNWPWSFDPTWVDVCNGFKKKEN